MTPKQLAQQLLEARVILTTGKMETLDHAMQAASFTQLAFHHITEVCNRLIELENLTAKLEKQLEVCKGKYGKLVDKIYIKEESEKLVADLNKELESVEV